MLNEEIDRLTEQLERVQLKQDGLHNVERELVNRIIEIHRKGNPARQQHARNPLVSPKGYKKMPTTNQDIKTKTTKDFKSDKKKKSKEEFAIGTRVRILNSKPRNRARYPSEKDKTGTIPRKTAFFIFIKTDNLSNTMEVRRDCWENVLFGFALRIFQFSGYYLKPFKKDSKWTKSAWNCCMLFVSSLSGLIKKNDRQT